MKKYRPVTKSERGHTGVAYTALTASEPYKGKTHGFKRSVGRNNQGRITTRHKGSGHKRLFREIDFRYEKQDIPARIETLEYDPNRSGFIGLVVYADGERRYVLLPQKVKVGDTVVVGEKVPVKAGNRLPLRNIPVGTFVYNVELKPGGGAKLARSAGVYAEVIAYDAPYIQLKMPSSEVRKVHENAWASVGEVSNEEYHLQNLGKAGRSRWLGIRPTVRGTAMNPVDHPHGGGEGRQGRGRRRAVTLWGRPSGKGQKTRKKKYSDSHIVSRRKVGKKR